MGRVREARIGGLVMSGKTEQQRSEELREAAVRASLPLLDRAMFNDAEESVLAADDSIVGRRAVARMYEHHLRKLVELGTHRKSPELVDEVFRRAVRWAHAAYPEARSSADAEEIERGRSQDSVRLAGIVGGDLS